MIIPDLKKRVTTVMASRRSPSGEPLSGPAPMKPEVMKEENGELDGRHEAAQDMLAAMHEGSAHKMVEAMANFMDLHNSRPKMAEPE